MACDHVPRTPLTTCPQVRDLIQNSEPDPSMYGALPPGAWWEVANGELPSVQPYGPSAGERAVVAAQTGDLELRAVDFAYPARPDAGVLRVGWRTGGGRW